MKENSKFNEALNNSGMTMYALSKLSGVPYTTVNEIHRGKLDINQCAVGTVHRLAGVLDVPADSIINEIDYLDGMKGRYRGIDYIWSTDGGTTHLIFEYEGEPVKLDTGAFYNIPSRMKYYSIIAGWMIDDYAESAEWDKAMDKRIAEMRTV